MDARLGSCSSSEEAEAISEPGHENSDARALNPECGRPDACATSWPDTDDEFCQSDLPFARMRFKALPDTCLQPTPDSTEALAALAAQTAAAAMAQFDACKAQWQSSESYGFYVAGSAQHMAVSDLADYDACWPDTDDEHEVSPSFELEMPALLQQFTVQGQIVGMPVAFPANFDRQVPQVAQGLGKQRRSGMRRKSGKLQ